jgi:hypothetical protein
MNVWHKEANRAEKLLASHVNRCFEQISKWLSSPLRATLYCANNARTSPADLGMVGAAGLDACNVENMLDTVFACSGTFS